jgi:multidrug efflux pump subunit AcrB
MASVGVRPVGAAGAGPAGGVPVAFLPKDDKNTFLVRIHLAETTPLEVMDAVAREVEVGPATPLTPIHHKNGKQVHYIGGELAAGAPVYAILGLALMIIDFARERLRASARLEEALRNAGTVRPRPIRLATPATAADTWIVVPDPVLGCPRFSRMRARAAAEAVGAPAYFRKVQ